MAENIFKDLGVNMDDPAIAEHVMDAMHNWSWVGPIVAMRQERGPDVDDVAFRMGVPVEDVLELEKPGADFNLSILRRYSLAVGACVDHRVRHALDTNESPEEEK